jgi:hypothetical protein
MRLLAALCLAWPPLAIALAATLAAAPAAAPAAASDLVGHRALYTLRMETTRGEITGASGTMGFEMIDACDAWAVRQRLTMTVTGRDGTEIDLTSEYTTWESKDGLKLRFRMRQTTDDAVALDLAGTAELERPGGPGRVTYSQPADTAHPLPPGTMFPTAHTEALLAAARAGQRFVTIPIFDGTSADGVQDSTIAIASSAPPAANEFPALAALPSTRVRIAFFARDGAKQQPEYEVGMRYWANGVADQLSMDFGDYVMGGKMTELTLPKPGC